MAKQTFSVGQTLTAAQMTSLQQTAMLGGEASAKTASYTLVAADAGTAISMSNASATTITVNTALFAAGDTVHITNLGAGVCTVTAGTATVNSSASLALAQYESGFLDFTSTSAAIFVKGAGAAAASSGMTLIQRSTFTSVAGTGTTFDGVFSSTYVSYLIEVENLFAATTGDDLQFVFRISAADAAAHYGNQIFVTASGTTFTSIASSNAAQLVLYSEPTTSGNPAVGQIFVSNIGTTKIPSMNGSLLSNSDNRSLAIVFGVNNLASTYTGFRLKSASSNITGTVAVYGLAK